jgi:hypothetical protein
VLPTAAPADEGPLLGYLKLGGALAGWPRRRPGLLLLLHGHAVAGRGRLRRLLAPLPARWVDVIAQAVATFAEGLAVLKPHPDICS